MLGTTLEFYSLTCLELTRPSNRLWHTSTPLQLDEEFGVQQLMGIYPDGLFPAPFAVTIGEADRQKRLDLFMLVGRLLAKAICGMQHTRCGNDLIRCMAETA